MNAVIAEAAGAAQGAAAKVDAAGMVQGAVDKAVTGNVTVDADAAAGQIVAAMAPEKEAAVNQVTAALNGLDTAALKAMLLQFLSLIHISSRSADAHPQAPSRGRCCPYTRPVPPPAARPGRGTAPETHPGSCLLYTSRCV